MLTLRIEMDYYYLISEICNKRKINLTDFIREAIDLNIDIYNSSNNNSNNSEFI